METSDDQFSKNQSTLQSSTANFSNYISPNFKSTPLFAPLVSPYQQSTRYNNCPPPQVEAWGTHMHRYAGIGPLPYLGLRPKTRDLHVARSHRHYLSGLSYVRHDKVTPTQITPFKKSLNRACDDLVPPAALIPLEKYSRIVENTKLVNEAKYASHQERTELFPQRDENTVLTKATGEVVRRLLDKRYGQTTYSESYYDQRNNTTLTLGPQFQFYECDEETTDEEEEDEATTGSTVCEEDTRSESPESEASGSVKPDGDHEDTAEEEEEEEKEEKEAENAENSETKIKDTVEVEKPLEEEFQENLNVIRNTDRPFWPAWPGNLSNGIDPYTLKIAEKRDVCCREDEQDVRALPVLTPAKRKEYNVLQQLGQCSSIANHKLAPAKTNFAYSGQQSLYGCSAERQFYQTQIPKVPSCSRFKPIPSYLDENIDRICENSNKMSRPVSAKKFTPHPPKTPKKSSSLERLQQTIESLQEPTQKPQIGEDEEEETVFPPLWETLSYSGDRVVDKLGCRFKTAAQARYHSQHPEKTQLRLPERFDHVCFRMVLSTGRRRQYYNGHHSCSMFR